MKILLNKTRIQQICLLLILAISKEDSVSLITNFTLSPKSEIKRDLPTSSWEKIALKYPDLFPPKEFIAKKEAIKRDLSKLHNYLENILPPNSKKSILSIFVTGDYAMTPPKSPYPSDKIEFVIVLSDDLKNKDFSEKVSTEIIEDFLLEEGEWGYDAIQRMNLYFIFESDFWKKSRLSHTKAFYLSHLIEGKIPWKHPPYSNLFIQQLLPYLSQNSNSNKSDEELLNIATVQTILFKEAPALSLISKDSLSKRFQLINEKLFHSTRQKNKKIETSL